MSKYLKDLITKELQTRWHGVSDAVLVNLAGMTSNANNRFRMELQRKNMDCLVIKNSLARRATKGTRLAPMFEGMEGASAVVWGGTDVVALTKEVVRLVAIKDLAPLSLKGGVVDGEKIDAAGVTGVSKWPTREEQLSLLVGQILGPGAKLASQLKGPGGALVSQVKSKGEGGDKEGGEAPAA